MVLSERQDVLGSPNDEWGSCMRLTGPIAGADRIADRANRESSGEPHSRSCEQGLLCRTEDRLESKFF